MCGLKLPEGNYSKISKGGIPLCTSSVLPHFLLIQWAQVTWYSGGKNLSNYERKVRKTERTSHRLETRWTRLGSADPLTLRKTILLRNLCRRGMTGIPSASLPGFLWGGSSKGRAGAWKVVSPGERDGLPSASSQLLLPAPAAGRFLRAEAGEGKVHLWEMLCRRHGQLPLSPSQPSSPHLCPACGRLSESPDPRHNSQFLTAPQDQTLDARERPRHSPAWLPLPLRPSFFFFPLNPYGNFRLWWLFLSRPSSQLCWLSPGYLS